MNLNLKWRRDYWLIVYGVIAYLLFLVIQLPVSFVWQQIPAPVKQTISFSSLEGSAWSATATGVIINGYNLGTMSWQLSPLSLLTGHLGGAVQVRHALGTTQGKFDIDNAQLVELHNLQGNLNANLFDSLIRPVMLNGQIHVDIESARLQRSSLLEIEGTAQWRDARISGVQDLDLGQIIIKAVPDAGGSRFQVSNQDGALEVNGEVRLATNGRYDLNLTLMNRDKSRTELDTMLRMLGKPDARGRVNLKQAGMIPGFR